MPWETHELTSVQMPGMIWAQKITESPKEVSQNWRHSQFSKKVANGQLQKPVATTTLKFEIRDKKIAERYVVMNKLPGPMIGLHFMRNNSVVIDTIHGLIHFPHLTMQVKTAPNETTANHSQSSLTIPWRYHRGQQNQSQLLLTIRKNGT